MIKPQNCLITGAAQGLGKSLMAFYQAQQWQTYGIDALLPEHADLQRFFRCDLAQHDAVNHFCHQLETLPGMQTVIMNAAAYHFTPFAEVTMAMLQQIMQINTFSHMQLIQALLNTHHRSSLKHIIVIGSDQVFDAKDYNCAYAMSKAALMQMVRTFACEYTHPKIIGLCPHTIANTQITQQAACGIAALDKVSVETVLQSFDEESTTGKMIDPNHLARFIFDLDQTDTWQSGSVIEVTPQMVS